MPRASETVLEVDLQALEHNYRFLTSKLRPTTKFLGVVKACAYGSDMVKVALTLEQLGVDYLAVAYVSEGVVLRNAGIKTPILVLHPQPVNFDALISHSLEPSLYSLRILKSFVEALQKGGKTAYPVHLKFNTGLNRLGLNEHDLDEISEQLKGRSELKVLSVFSHLAASEDRGEKDFTERQIAAFKKLIPMIDTVLGDSPLKHLLNTSGIINYPEAQFDMVRSGIGLYGYGNEASINAQLKPIATLKTVISQIHKIQPNESVGYNRAYRSDGDRVTATLPIGHADGIGRHYGSGKAFVSVHGKKAPIIGNVCMDMMMIDITGIECAEGDEVIVFGPDNPAAQFAAYAGTISYEIITGISQRIKRTYLNTNLI